MQQPANNKYCTDLDSCGKNFFECEWTHHHKLPSTDTGRHSTFIKQFI